MTTEEILLTVLTVAIVVLIATVLAVLFMVLKIIKKLNTAVTEVQQVVTSGSDFVQSLAPVGLLTALIRTITVMKKRK